MNLSPALQQAIETITSNQGISPEQSITQAITEKISSLTQQTPDHVQPSTAKLVEQDGLLVVETDSLEGIDFNQLLEENRDHR